MPASSPALLMQRRHFMLTPLALFVLARAPLARAASSPDEPFSFYFPTPDASVQRMLELARVTATDFVIDLGSGDGRIVLTAAQRYGARGLGVDIDKALVEQSNAEAQRRKLADKVRFEHGDVMNADISRATVITLFLMPGLIARLQPRFLAELKPGTRIVTHEFPLFDWPADETVVFYAPTRGAGTGGDSTVKLWTVPANFSGDWALQIDDVAIGAFELALTQRYQRVSGGARLGAVLRPLLNVWVRGTDIAFSVENGSTEQTFSGRIAGDALAGDVRIKTAGATRSVKWSARRVTPAQPIDRPVR